ncbi:branched-chain amino acid ABC transporter permease [Halovenus sp. WSH3]|uniref:Branched-chain amino acid ABC transporter permease n=1 Tax=Halovenus carboxidivorans TaxID=2692199 RepID=A0A6B0T2F1_9EURY|nr:branched-chain amino acid ABC transporter permease [Halovenus carboxidivorans]MXR52418.1 branched-chain amino acid ABC transporter permease [Halovenus carboxidivorans]
MSYGFTERLQDRRNATGAAILVAVALVAAPFLLGGYQVNLLAETLCFVLFATAFNLLYGYTGLLSFGHAMFVAIAGYAVALTVTDLSPMLGVAGTFGGAAPLATWFLALVVGVVAATLLAVFIGFLSVRLEEIYFAIITLSFSMAIYVIVLQDTVGSLLGQEITNGSDGLTFIMGFVELFGWEFRLVDILNPLAYYFLTLVVVSIAMFTLWRITRSPFGMICLAIRENPERVESLGINVRFHRWITFIISGAFSGLAGALLIPLYTNVNPQYAYWTFSARPVIMTVIGGPYAFLGPAIGAFTYEYLRWFIRQFPALEANWQISLGLLLLVVVLFFNNGVAGGVNRFRAWIGVAVNRYHKGGVRGVVSLVRETIMKYVRLVWTTLRGGARSLMRRVGIGS